MALVEPNHRMDSINFVYRSPLAGNARAPLKPLETAREILVFH